MLTDKHLWSLYDMLIFNASGFIEIIGLFENVKTAISTSAQLMSQEKFALKASDFEKVKASANTLRDRCRELRLALTAMSAQRLLDFLITVEANGIVNATDREQKSQQYFTFDSTQKEMMRARLTDLSGRITDEFSITVFLVLSEREAAYFDTAKFPFGDVVATKLPTTVEDISEASKCISLGRFTASVFHLMRALEVAVQKLGDKLGIVLIDSRGKPKLWQNILDEINKEIKALDQQAPLTKRLAAISSHLYNVKLAWRNEVMHPKETYTEEEALVIFNATKAFANELASAL